MANCSALDCRKMLTSEAMMMPNTPMIRNERRVAGHGVGEHDVGDETGQSYAGRHVIVDAQHVCAQTFVYGNIGARAEASLRIPVVDLSHWSIPSALARSSVRACGLWRRGP